MENVIPLDGVIVDDTIYSYYRGFVYIYILADPDTQEIKYVGQSLYPFLAKTYSNRTIHTIGIM